MNRTTGDPAAYRQQLERLVLRIAGLVERLSSILEEERSALAQQDADRLHEITTGKMTCVQRIEEAEAERRRLCESLGFSADESGMIDLARWCSAGTRLEAAWKEVMHRAKRSEAMNRTNAAIGHARLRQVSDALAVLNGVDAGQGLYDPQGAESAGFERRAIARI